MPSLGGHMWYSISDGQGDIKSFGFQSSNGNPGFDPRDVPNGNVSPHDLAAYGEGVTSLSLQISAEQYNALKDFGQFPSEYGFDNSNYELLINSCVDFAYYSMRYAGLTVESTASGQGYLWPGNNVAALQAWMEDNIDRIAWFESGHSCSIVPVVNTNFTSALTFIPRIDPLALDLDGDGIETISANSGITFDFDGDGLKTGTGWVKGDDGFLVLDRNGNGAIDTGKELFGVDTLKSNGQLASDGFDALRDLDGNADGLFNAQDAQFANVRVWQDLNQDGVAQAGELKSLAEHNITAINLAATQTVENSNGNLISAVGSFTRGDGTVGTVNGNQSLVANLDLASNPFYREFTDSLPLDEAAQALPDMQGSGAVRDLRQASMLNAELKTLLTAYSQAQTRAEQMALLDQLVTEWAESAGNPTFAERIHALSDAQTEVRFEYSWEAAGTQPTAEQLAHQKRLERLNVLEAFNAQSFLTFSNEGAESEYIFISIGIGASRGTFTFPAAGNSVVITENTLGLNFGQIDFLDRSYDALLDSVYQGLLLQTRLSPYVDLIELTLGQDGLRLDYSAITQSLEQLGTTDPVAAIIDAGDLRQVLPQALNATVLGTMTEGWLGQLTQEQLQCLNQQLGGQVLHGVEPSESLVGSQGHDFLLGHAGTDVLHAGRGHDFLSGGEGDDHLNGGEGNDLLLGGVGMDYLQGETGSDVLIGGADSDYLGGGEGDDILEGGAGNDALSGDGGADIYRFSRGWGNDTIYDSDVNSGVIDAIEFTADITPADIVITRSGNDLILKLQNSEDQVTFSYYFEADASSPYVLEEIRFANGTVWTVAQIKEMALQGTDGDDLLYSYAAGSTLSGGLGSDVLYGNVGNDTLLGGDGSDYLYGDTGNDLLDGGLGSDVMYGGAGDDIYVVDNDTDYVAENPGEGVDTVKSYVSFTLDANTEHLTLLGTNAINATGNAASNNLYGNLGDNVLQGGGGNDTLTGDAGNDRLDGGAGNDIMLGGVGNDTYVVGSTSDVVTENANEGSDTIEASITLTLGNNVENLTLTGSSALNGTGNALDNILTGNSGKNTLTGGAGNDRLDGKGGIDTLLGGAGDDTYVVDLTTDVITENAGEGNDTVESSVTLTLGNNLENLTLTGTAALNGTGNALDNILTGNSGKNTLTGGAGNDRLDGQAGADTLTGGVGNDTYVLGRGYGADTVVESDATAGNTDVAQFLSGIATDQLWFTKALGTNNLEVSVIGTSDKLIIKDWYVGTANHVEQFKTSDGKTLLDSQVQNLVNAMSAFAPPAAGQTSLPSNYHAALDSVIAANWQ